MNDTRRRSISPLEAEARTVMMVESGIGVSNLDLSQA
jgi:hypothetical protein